MKKICIICHTNIQNDPRVVRQINSLKQDYDVYVVGNGKPLQNVKFFSWDACYHKAANKLEFIFYALCHLMGWFTKIAQRFSITDFKELKEAKFSFVLVNELNSLPLGFLIAKGAPVHCDLHEYYLDEINHSFHEKLTLKYYHWLCIKMLPKCMSLSTVSRGLVDLYEKLTGKRPFLLINAPHEQNFAVNTLDESKIRLIHHGYADERRQLERYIEMMDYVDERFTLDLMLTTDSPYREKLRIMASGHSNVYWREPVPMTDIVSEINKYDMGICSYHLNHLKNIQFSLPNKFFEYIQARLGVLISPLPELIFYVKEYKIGKIANSASPQDLAKALNSLSIDEVREFKINADNVASHLTAEVAQNNFKCFLQEKLKTFEEGE